MLALAYDLKWNNIGKSVQKGISEILSEIILEMNNQVSEEMKIGNMLESLTCSMLQPEDTEELKSESPPNNGWDTKPQVFTLPWETTPKGWS